MKARIRELIHAVPFQPFIIRMADGREYRVDHLISFSLHPKTSPG